MADINVHHVLTLAHLLSKGAKHNFVVVTTTELGNAISKSQQAASRHLLELEKNGFIERMLSDRHHYSVRITASGYREMIKLRRILGSSMDSSPSQIVLKGKLVSGMGEGAYYMSLGGYTRQFRSKIGYVPFPGTLNVKLDKKEYVEVTKQFDALDGVKIDGFSDRRRTYGWVKCFAGRVNSVDCQLIRLERTHHDSSVIELISRHNIRKSARMSDGSVATVKILT